MVEGGDGGNEGENGRRKVVVEGEGELAGLRIRIGALLAFAMTPCLAAPRVSTGRDRLPLWLGTN